MASKWRNNAELRGHHMVSGWVMELVMDETAV